MSDVNTIKLKTLEILTDLRKEINNRNSDNTVEALQSSFNSAEMLFVSYRLAELAPHLAISKMILKFKTPWPRRSYLQSGDVSKVYNKKFSFITSSAMMILMFLIQQLMSANISIQDLIIHEICAVFTAYVLSLFLSLYNIYPALVAAPVIGAIVIIHFLIQANARRTSANTTSPSPAFRRVAPAPAAENMMSFDIFKMPASPPLVQETDKKDILNGASCRHLVEHGDDNNDDVAILAQLLPDLSDDEESKDDDDVNANRENAINVQMDSVNREIFAAALHLLAEDVSTDSDEIENLRQLANYSSINTSDNAIEGISPIASAAEEKFGLSDVNLSSDDDGSDIEKCLVSNEKAQIEHVMRENIEDTYTTRTSSPPAAVVVDVAYESPDGDSDLDDNSMQQDPQLDFNIRLQSRIREILLSDDSSSTDSFLL